MDVENFWSSALKATGPVAVVGFVIWLVVQFFFDAEIITLFTSQQRFVVVLIIICALLVIFYAAIRGHYSTKGMPLDQALEGNRTAKITKSKINGDFVMGDKVNNKEQ